jgi:hypothetical protein
MSPIGKERMSLTRKHFYFDPERHAVLLAWLEQQDNQSETIRELIEAKIASEQGNNNSQPAPVNVEELRQVIREELARVQIHGNVGEPQAASSEAEEVTELMGDLLSNWDFEDET